MAAVPPQQPPQPPFTVYDAMVKCGVDTTLIFNGNNKAQRIATDLFDDDFHTCIDKTIEELNSDLKDYSQLTVNQGQINLSPATKKNVRAFLHWVKHKFRINEEPSMEEFDTSFVTDIMRRATSHQAFVDKSKTMSDTATPSKFTNKIKWIDWVPTFRNFLRAIPSRNGAPLSYVIRDDATTPRATYVNFLDEYIDKAPLQGSAFIIDTAEVHTYLIKFISENETAESKIQSSASNNDGRSDFMKLKEHYEGTGVNALDVTRADRILETLFYSGEKRPNMWWSLFEQRLEEAYTIYDKNENRSVHSENMKLRTLCKKITADFLQSTKSAIQIELARVPMTITYEEALNTFRNQVNLKFPPELSSQHNRNRVRRINETNSRSRSGFRGGRSGRGGRFHRGGGRFHGRGGRGRGDASIITIVDAKE